MKKVLGISSAPGRHWVGNGFPVHGMFGYNGDDVASRSPFLLLDYAAPIRFEPTTERRGVGQHPHRGFETVTIVYAGEVEHRDSTGNGGVIGGTPARRRASRHHTSAKILRPTQKCPCIIAARPAEPRANNPRCSISR